MRTVAVAVSANRDFACSHGYTVATLLPQTQGKMRQNGVFRVCMSQTEKGAKSADLTYENDLFRGCAPGVTRTPDPRIRNPLLYPAELRAQNWQGHIQRFATNKRKRAAPFVVLLEPSIRCTTQRHQHFFGPYADNEPQAGAK